MKYQREGKPAEYQHEKNDCVVLAISVACCLPYGAAHAEMKQHGRKDRHKTKLATYLKTVGNRIANYDLVPMPLASPSTIKQTVLKYPNGRYLVRTKGHLFAVVNGVIFDSGEKHEGVKRRVTNIWQCNAR